MIPFGILYIYLYHKTKRKKNKIMKIEKLTKTNVPVEFQKQEGCMAFQMVKITYSFYGSEMSELFDTKIIENGKQFIINGNGFIKDGFQIN